MWLTSWEVLAQDSSHHQFVQWWLQILLIKVRLYVYQLKLCQDILISRYCAGKTEYTCWNGEERSDQRQCKHNTSWVLNPRQLLVDLCEKSFFIRWAVLLICIDTSMLAFSFFARFCGKEQYVLCFVDCIHCFHICCAHAFLTNVFTLSSNQTKWSDVPHPQTPRKVSHPQK